MMDNGRRPPLRLPFKAISDTHFHHTRLAEEYEPVRMTLGADHNTVMVRRWREEVGDDEPVLHLGDLTLGKREQAETTLERLTGRMFLILGNHDRRGARWYREQGFTVVKPFALEYNGWRVHFQHYPDDSHELVCYPRTIVVHGHVHSKTREDRRMINLSAEACDFRPVDMAAVLDERIAELQAG